MDSRLKIIEKIDWERSHQEDIHDGLYTTVIKKISMIKLDTTVPNQISVTRLRSGSNDQDYIHDLTSACRVEVCNIRHRRDRSRLFISYKKAFATWVGAVVRYKGALTAQHRLFVNYKIILLNPSSQKGRNYANPGQFFSWVVTCHPIQENELFTTEVKCPCDSRRTIVGD